VEGSLLSAGDAVIVVGNRDLEDGDEVNVTNAGTGTNEEPDLDSSGFSSSSAPSSTPDGDGDDTEGDVETAAVAPEE
jgi:hypothetical protein